MEVKFNRQIKLEGVIYQRDHEYNVKGHKKTLENLIEKGFVTLLKEKTKPKKKSEPKKKEEVEETPVVEVVESEESEDSELTNNQT